MLSGFIVGAGCGIAVGSTGANPLQTEPQVVMQSHSVAQKWLQVVRRHHSVAQELLQVGLHASTAAHSAREVGMLEASSIAAASAVYFLNMMFTSKVLRLCCEPWCNRNTKRLWGQAICQPPAKETHTNVMNRTNRIT